MRTIPVIPTNTQSHCTEKYRRFEQPVAQIDPIRFLRDDNDQR